MTKFCTLPVSVAVVSSIAQNLCQISITHPSPDYTITVTGTGDNDLNPAVYPDDYEVLLNGYTEQLNKGDAFNVLADGRIEILISGVVNITAYADIEHSANNSTVGAAFSIVRDASTILSARAVHSKLPNTGDIGNISGGGSFTAVAGDVVGIALASDLSGDLSIRSSSVVIEMFA